MKVTVTQIDIDAGRRSASFSCPVALAVRRLFPDASIDVGGNIRIGNKFFIIPWKAAHFIALFDASEPVEPFEFELSDTPEYEGSEWMEW